MKNIPQIILTSSVSLATPVKLSASTVQNYHFICKMSYAQAFAAIEYQIRLFTKMGVTEVAASKANASIYAYRTLRNNKYMCEILCSETNYVCQTRKRVRGTIKTDRKEVAV